MRLEAEGLAAGGKVHALIGNHEAGAMNCDLRNVLHAIISGTAWRLV